MRRNHAQAVVILRWFELINAHHGTQELDYGFRRQSNENLAFAALLGISDAVRAVILYLNYQRFEANKKKDIGTQGQIREPWDLRL